MESGNHRAGEVMLKEYNLANSPLYVVRVLRVTAYEKFSETPLTYLSSFDIQFEPGLRK